MLEVAKVLKVGADRYAPNNWRKIDTASHLNHAMTHLLNFQDYRLDDLKTEDDKLEELAHFACRALMALETFLWEFERRKPPSVE